MNKGLKKTGRKAFTLIELLVVIAIIALLLSIIMPALKKAKRYAQETICISNLHQLAIAALTYEHDHGRLPGHSAEPLPRTTVPQGGWPEQMASVGGPDNRPLWIPYIPDLEFLSCCFLKPLDINIENIPLNSHRIYSGYTFIFGYWRDRKPDGSWASESERWTKTNQVWKYMGRRVDVLAGDRNYSSPSNEYYRVNHGARLGFAANYVPVSDPREYVVSVYEKSGVKSEEGDLRKKTTSAYCFKDGSAEKYNGSDERLIDLLEPSDQSGREGLQLVPLR
jgi:prepilin-type N-terminal cleavage/methylation domain-containing protein